MQTANWRDYGAYTRRYYKSGSNGGGNGNGTSTTVSKVELPPWVDASAKNNYEMALGVSNNLMGPYTGQRVAGMTDGANADVAALQNNVGSTNPAFAYAQGGAADAMGYNPAMVNPGQLANTDLAPYMNPYTQNVIGTGLNALNLQRMQALNQVGDQATRTHAFGGSRQGVAEGVTNAGAAMQAGTLASQLMAQNYDQAQRAAQADIATNLTGQQSNQQAGLAGAGLNLNAANSLGNLASSGQNAFLQGDMAALQAQTLKQQEAQSQLTAQQQAYQEAQQFPLQQLQIRMGALGMSPYGQTTSQTAPVPQGNGAMQTMGTIGSGLGILGSLASTGAMIFSDREEKTDIKKLGKDTATGLNLYAYRYKGDPKSYPKVVGPMAQDIEKKYPGSVSKVGGRRVVNLGFGG